MTAENLDRLRQAAEQHSRSTGSLVSLIDSIADASKRRADNDIPKGDEGQSPEAA